MRNINDPQLNLNTIDNLKTFDIVYDDSHDVFFARPSTPRPATSLDWEGEIWLRIDPETGDIVGLEIDDFESVFLKKYPALAKAWQEVKPLCHRKRTDRHEDESWESFLRIMYVFFRDFIKNNPSQSAFGIV
ncbi:MAG: hypothetical protein A2Z28_03200 [Chloroflexi bacterium RBG_16_51_9]|nr:MAG: hypothetical protein A2Z28_03200 [Chloroflexi bacterium RBG_16_51_9]